MSIQQPLRMKLLVGFVLLALTQTAYGYILDESYDWDPVFDATKYEASIVQGEEATVIFDKSMFCYYTNSAGTMLMLKNFEHRLLWIEDESAIAKLNQVFLPSSASGFKARIINSKGEVVNFDESKIEEIITDEGTSSYQKLALPGIEPKSWVEIYFVMENLNRTVRVTIDDEFATSLAQVVITEPTKWLGKFDLSIQGFNGYEKNESSSVGQSVVYEARNIHAVGEEEYAHDYNDSPRLDYTLNGTSWKSWSGLVYESLNHYQYKSFKGPINKTLNSIVTVSMSELDKIIAIEKYVKQNITRTDQDGKEYSAYINKILKGKIANEDGIISTFMHLLFYADINFELYLVGDEDYIDTDDKFVSLRGLSNFLFYFPLDDVYMVPTNNYYYTGKIPNYMGGLNALRIVSDEHSNGHGDRDYLRKLPKGDKEYNVESTFSEINFDPDTEECTIKLRKSYVGDHAIRSRGVLNFSDQAEKKEYVDFVLLSGMETTELKSYEIENDAIELNVMSTEKLKFSGVLESDEMATTIPTGFIVNASKPMGSQTSFYEEGERQRNICALTARVYEHDIRFSIPEGYKVEGLENYVFNEEYTFDGDVVASFVSTAEIIGDEVVLTVYEFYEEGVYPKEDIEAYKMVINAAYEFYIAKLQLIKID